jgi:hypothetical protein
MAIYRLAADMISVPVQADERAMELHTAFQDVVVSAVQILRKDCDYQRSCGEEYLSAFDEIVHHAGHTHDERVKLNNVRQSVMLLARHLLDESGMRRGDDPPNCDPGGGMRSPDELGDDDDRESSQT